MELTGSELDLIWKSWWNLSSECRFFFPISTQSRLRPALISFLLVWSKYVNAKSAWLYPSFIHCSFNFLFTCWVWRVRQAVWLVIRWGSGPWVSIRASTTLVCILRFRSIRARALIRVPVSQVTVIGRLALTEICGEKTTPQIYTRQYGLIYGFCYYSKWLSTVAYQT